ncbi:Y-family DNA polymerase [Companilactobacillus pabuli]|jgi:DNA polymerase V|uniref:Y-family DNA polymerase n=1 Tax=Companilactobacillus pabuli TaxID=2714036 RepID=A0A7L7KWA4_9LACO|nr:Y-family DNA polymerase [Companilactobacillus pabuli]AKP03260.1 excinuclease ABC subunit A [Companilactobacillus farciminis]AKS51560.1 excinuclease ABC subunit A [Companilactobacillus farciminis]QMT83334.1 Y-family DNA polymerase [Companilactobacillus pabuli]GAQ02428.1 type VI secretion protein ImpB [Companilactobacillus farciminis]
MDYRKEPHGVYFLIDNKSFYASVEATLRGLNPLKELLVVMSEADNAGSGLILATSPMAKKIFHLKANVSRQRDLPQDPRLIVVPPRMNLYIKRNLQINNIFREFAAEKDVWPYSIDESIIDMTHSWKLFGDSPKQVARLIQIKVRKELGLYTTVGIGDNPLQAKIALDIYAKHNPELIAEIHYQTVPEKIWTISELTDVWSIAKRTKKRLNRLGIHNMYELANTNPFYLKQELGLIGEQLFAISWGIDRTNLSDNLRPKNHSIGNSQVLPRDYFNQAEIETVIKEMGQQVASRLRHHHKQAGCISLTVTYSYSGDDSERGGFSVARNIDVTDKDWEINQALIYMFENYWQGQPVRNLAVYSSKLVTKVAQQLDFFTPIQTQCANEDKLAVIDQIRARYGFKSIVYANSLLKGGTAINRSSLVGGHNGGNAYE